MLDPRQAFGELAASCAQGLAHAARVFDLPAADRDALALLLADRVAPAPGRRGGGLRADELAATLAAVHGAVAAWTALEPTAPLRWNLLVELVGEGPGRSRQVHLVEDFWSRLIGIPPRGPYASAPAPERLDRLALAPALRTEVMDVATWLGSPRSTWPTLSLVGPDGSGRGALARALAATRALAVITVDARAVTSASIATLRREVTWQQAALLLEHGEGIAATLLADLVSELPAPVFLTGTCPQLEPLLGRNRDVRILEVPRLHAHDRTAIWTATLAEHGRGDAAIDAAFLGARFGFTPQRIAAAGAALGRQVGDVDTAAAVRLCRTLPEVRVGGLASRVETPYQWHDVVVPPAVRRELDLIVTWARHAPALFAQGTDGARARAPAGLACLFYGPPGTGKTLAAQVIAGQLGLELYRVDLAAVVDKYIGETEKRLDLLFREAEAAGVILLFDEADALFTQRTEVKDARDRYANLETGFLLQRLEDHRGLTILASNHQQNVDAAFHRRLGVIVQFPLPATLDRRTLWTKLLPPGAVADADLEFLAECAGLSGGEIRNAVVFATLLAQQQAAPLATRHLVIGVWRELNRAGRLVNPADFGRWALEVERHVRLGRA